MTVRTKADAQEKSPQAPASSGTAVLYRAGRPGVLEAGGGLRVVAAPACAPPGERGTHRLYVHVVWRTLQGLALIGPERSLAVEGHVVALCRRLDVEPVAVLAAEDRLHLLLRFKPGHALAGVVRHVKAGSSEALARAGHPVRWSRGYAISTLGPSEVSRLKEVLLTRAMEDGYR